MYVPLKPLDWPQDALNIPDGQHGMPPVDHVNSSVVGAEFFYLSARFQWAAGTAAQTVKREVLQTSQDGDFWCDQIGVVSWLDETGEAKDQQSFLASMVTIKDIRTGRSPVFNRGLPTGVGANQIPINSVPINLFRKLPQSGTEPGAVAYDGSVPVPAGFRTTGALIQPYCFTRQGGIEVTMTNLYAVPALHAFDVTIGFGGWKEYTNASR